MVLFSMINIIVLFWLWWVLVFFVSLVVLRLRLVISLRLLSVMFLLLIMFFMFLLVIVLKLLVLLRVMLCFLVFVMIVLVSGCLDFFLSVVVRCRILVLLCFGLGRMDISCGLFLVRVLVLLIIRVLIFLKCLRVLVFLISMFVCVLWLVVVMIDIGVVRLSV